MAQCNWCDKSLLGDTVPACGSCLLRSAPQDSDSSKSVNSEEQNKGNYSLAYLENPEPKKSKPKGKSLWAVANSIREVSKKPVAREQGNKLVKSLQIKSNSLRDRSFVAESLVLNFDGNGLASFKESDLTIIQSLMKSRPNRFSIVESTEDLDVVAKLDAARLELKKFQEESMHQDSLIIDADSLMVDTVEEMALSMPKSSNKKHKKNKKQRKASE